MIVVAAAAGGAGGAGGGGDERIEGVQVCVICPCRALPLPSLILTTTATAILRSNHIAIDDIASTGEHVGE